jgi:anthranilate phosphoribosyltransferase
LGVRGTGDPFVTPAPLLERLLGGDDLLGSEIEGLIDAWVDDRLAPEALAGLLVAWRAKGETAAEIAATARAFLRHARPFPVPEGLTADCCGTGGDGAGTFNVSTAVAFVCAGAGLPVVKHGNRAVSSASGSADVCRLLGVPVELGPEEGRRLLAASGFAFLFAPFYHPATARAMPVRRALGVRTVFNLLGPLTNPAAPPVRLVGVYDPRLVRPIAEALALLGVRRALVVHGSGLDELALHGPSQGARLTENGIEDLVLTPQEAGLEPRPRDALRGGSPEENARALEAVLAGEGAPAYRDAVLLNAGALLWTAGLTADLAAGVERARDALASGAALRVLALQREYARGA